MIVPTTKDKFDSNNYNTVQNMCSVIELFQHIASKDNISYPMFDDKGYVHIVLWTTLDGRYRFHNSNKTNHKDRLYIDVKAYIHESCCFFQHASFDNLYSFKSRYLPNTIKIFIEISETQIKKSYIINQFEYDPFKKTNIFKLEPMESNILKNEQEEEIIKPKRKRKSNSR